MDTAGTSYITEWTVCAEVSTGKNVFCCYLHYINYRHLLWVTQDKSVNFNRTWIPETSSQENSGTKDGMYEWNIKDCCYLDKLLS